MTASDMYDKNGFQQLLLQSTVSVPMHSTASGRLSAKLEVEDVRVPSQASMLHTTDRVRGLKAEIDDLAARLNENNLSKKNLETKIAEEMDY